MWGEDDDAQRERERQEGLYQKGWQEPYEIARKSADDRNAQRERSSKDHDVIWEEKDRIHKGHHDRRAKEAQENEHWKKHNKSLSVEEWGGGRARDSHRSSGSSHSSDSSTSASPRSDTLAWLTGAIIVSLLLVSMKGTPPRARGADSQHHSQSSCVNVPDVLDPADFHRNLAVGDTGPDVCELQQFLITNGFLKISAPTGYFGEVTQAAVADWQRSIGLPNTGFFGHLSRAALENDLESNVH